MNDYKDSSENRLNSKANLLSSFMHTRGAKPLLIVVLLLLFLIPVHLIKSIIYDRQIYQENAIDSILEPLGGKPSLLGACIMVPYTQTEIRTVSDGKEVKQTKETVVKYLFERPTLFTLHSEVVPYTLTRGIYSVPVFNSTIVGTADFDAFPYEHFGVKKEELHLKEAVLLIGVSNKKILTELPIITIDGVPLEESLTDYSSLSPFAETVVYSLPSQYVFSSFHIDTTCKIQGGETLQFQPVGTNSQFTMHSTWKNPGFSGGWLPSDRNITKSGFDATWHIAGLSTNFPKIWTDISKRGGKNDSVVTTSFMTPVDSYQKTIRSIKYALLFLLVPFLAIFICEIFSQIDIHPIQYCLIGIADVMFYLLLLSISEHLDFNVSYYISACAVCGSTLFYASAIFKKIKWGLMLSATQFISYVFLFGTLQADDYALLIGSVGLFIVIVALMAITRKIDWYGKN